MDNIVGGKCSVSLITQLKRCIFSKNINIFRYLRLEIALAILALNDKKYNSNNSAGQGSSFASEIRPHRIFVQCTLGQASLLFDGKYGFSQFPSLQ